MRNGLVIDSVGDKYYYENDKLHRLGGLPAVEYADGNRCYYEYGLSHRLGGLPACDHVYLGDKFYYEYGNLHCLNRAAVKYKNGEQEWWVKGKRLDCTTQKEFEKLMKLKAFW